MVCISPNLVISLQSRVTRISHWGVHLLQRQMLLNHGGIYKSYLKETGLKFGLAFKNIGESGIQFPPACRNIFSSVLILAVLVFGFTTPEEAFGELGVPVIIIGGKTVDITQLKVTPKHLPPCPCIHLHPASGIAIFARDGTAIFDPAPTGCGFGCIAKFTKKAFILDLPLANDFDQDGVSNADEAKMETDPNNACSDSKVIDYVSDTDRDGLTYEQELVAGYDITLFDSNGNNIDDGLESALSSTKKDWYKIPILVDILKDSTTDPEIVEELIGDMNFVLMENDAKIMFHLVEVVKHSDNDGDPNGDGVVNTNSDKEIKAVRDSGGKEIENKIHSGLKLPGKGMKMTYVKELIDAGGWGSPGNPVTLLDPVPSNRKFQNAHVIAALHEFMHALGLFEKTGHSKDTEESDDNGPENPMSTPTHAYEFFMSKEEGEGLEGVRLTPTQIIRMQKLAKQFGIPGTGGSPYFMKQWQGGAKLDFRGDQTGINPGYLDITGVNMASEEGQDSISIIINLGDLYPDSGPVDATYSLSFDTDFNQITGSSVGSFNGIEQEVVIRVTGDTSIEALSASGIIFNKQTFLNTFLIPNPEIVKVVTEQDLPEIGSTTPNKIPKVFATHHQIRLVVSKGQLGLGSNLMTVRIMTRDQPDVFTPFNEIDTSSLILDLNAYSNFPTLVVDKENAKFGESVSYDIFGLTPNSNFDLELDNTIVDSGTTDSSGNFSSSFAFPQIDWGFHFLTAIDEFGIFTFNGIDGAPLLGDFKCYDSTGSAPGELVNLKDWFFTMDYEVKKTLGVCSNILKQQGVNFPASVTPDIQNQHFRIYRIRDATPVDAVVMLTDQFGPTQHTVGKAIELWSPASMTNSVFYKKFTDIHYKCYELEPLNPPLPGPLNVNTIDRFGNWSNEILKAEKLCSPVRKTTETASFGDPFIPDHLKCYNINPDPAFSLIPDILFGDQFVNEQNDLTTERDICLVAKMKIVAQADRDEDGVYDFSDNCLAIPNPDQEDLDLDQLGDACDAQNIILESRVITRTHNLTGHLTVKNGAVLTIPSGLSVNMTTGRKLNVNVGSSVSVEPGGTFKYNL